MHFHPKVIVLRKNNVLQYNTILYMTVRAIHNMQYIVAAFFNKSLSCNNDMCDSAIVLSLEIRAKNNILLKEREKSSESDGAKMIKIG